MDPVKAEVRTGLDAARLLPVGHGYAEVSVGLNNPWQGSLGAYVRGELGWHPTENLAAFAFAEANLTGATAGIGAKFTF